MATGWPMKTTYANGDVYSASDVNDTNGTINLLGSSVAYAAGKNKIINGDFEVWQRGTSISVAAGGNVFTSDRWQALIVGTTCTASRQTFTPGAAPVAGYESEFFHRIATGASTTYYELQQRIEDVRTLAGQTATYSFWAKATNAHTAAVYINQNFGVSGSANVGTASQNISLTTSWQRFTLTFSMPSISGKTVGASSYINPFIYYVSGTVANTSIDIWGVQLEQGSTATAFQTATGTIQGELAACQRYYFRMGGDQAYQPFGVGRVQSSTSGGVFVSLPVSMRVGPTAIDYSTILAYDGSASSAVTSLSINQTGKTFVDLLFGVASGLTAQRVAQIQANNSTSAYLGFNAEL